MGGGASMSQKQRRERDQERHRSLRAVERFVINCYATCPRVESMLLLLSSDLARRAFANFVKSERAEENLLLYNEVTALRSKKLSTYQLSKEIERIIHEYLDPDTKLQVMVAKSLRDTAESILIADKDSDEYVNDVTTFLSKLSDESIFLMARDQFNRFILSKFYKTWRATESSHAIATTAEDAKALAKASLHNSSSRSANSEATSFYSTTRRKKRRHEDLSVRAFMNTDVKEIGVLLGAESWLTALLAAAEGISLCFSLASARKDRRGFPLLYVNKYFEKTTGFSRHEVLGKSCKFLQCPETEKEKTQALGDALKNAQSHHTVLTNRTYSGKLFKNLVSIKPVIDELNTYCYVIAIHVDVSKENDDYVSKIAMVTDLMEMIPTTLYLDDDNDDACLPMAV